MKLPSWLRSFWSLVVRRRLIVTLVTVLAALSGTVWWCGWDWLRTVWWCGWKWLRTGSGDLESGSTTIRNVGLVVGGGIAIWVAYWRSSISQRSLLNERSQKGAEMLGSEVLSVRLGGIYALQRLAEEEPKQYHVQIMRLFCAFVRNPTKDEEAGSRSTRGVREDVQAVMTVIGTRSDDDIELEVKEQFNLDLAWANLTGVSMLRAIPISANLAGANLAGASMLRATLLFTNLSRVLLNSTDLTGAYLDSTDLTGAYLSGTNLTGASLSGAKGLTQEQLDQAQADPADPPKLDGLCDAKTGAPLEWRGKPCGN